MRKKSNFSEKIRDLRRFLREERRFPSYEEMLLIFNYRSKNAVFKFIRKLEKARLVELSPTGRIAPTSKLTGRVRLLGVVEAGMPAPAEEQVIDMVSLDEYLIRRPERTFLLRVSGDSMIEAHIQPGDQVIVEKGGTPKNCDIVVAQVDDEWTIKYFVEDAKGVRLEPANKKYKPIVPDRALVIGGIVRGVIRKL